MSFLRSAVVAALLLMGTVAFAGDPVGGESLPEKASPESPREAVTPPAIPLAERIDAVLAAERAACLEIATTLAAATDAQERQDLVLQLERTKAEAEIALLDLQAEAAETDGRTEAAQELRASAEQRRAAAGIRAAAAADDAPASKGGRS